MDTFCKRNGAVPLYVITGNCLLVHRHIHTWAVGYTIWVGYTTGSGLATALEKTGSGPGYLKREYSFIFTLCLADWSPGMPEEQRWGERPGRGQGIADI